MEYGFPRQCVHWLGMTIRELSALFFHETESFRFVCKTDPVARSPTFHQAGPKERPRARALEQVGSSAGQDPDRFGQAARQVPQGNTAQFPAQVWLAECAVLPQPNSGTDSPGSRPGQRTGKRRTGCPRSGAALPTGRACVGERAGEDGWACGGEGACGGCCGRMISGHTGWACAGGCACGPAGSSSPSERRIQPCWTSVR